MTNLYGLKWFVPTGWCPPIRSTCFSVLTLFYWHVPMPSCSPYLPTNWVVMSVSDFKGFPASGTVAEWERKCTRRQAKLYDRIYRTMYVQERPIIYYSHHESEVLRTWNLSVISVSLCTDYLLPYTFYIHENESFKYHLKKNPHIWKKSWETFIHPCDN